MRKLLAAILLLTAASSRSDIIDDYENGSINLTRSIVGTTSAAEGPIAGVLGAWRNFDLTVTAIVAPIITSSKALVVASPTGLLIFSNDLGVNSRLDMRYDANGAGLGANLSSSVAFQLDIFAADLPVPALVTVWDNDSSDSVLGIIPSGLFNSVSFPFVSFTGINFSQVERVDLSLDTILAGDVALLNFQTVVPETSTWVGILGLTGLMIWRLRR